ncbi:MAG: putative bifunctional diguanylate cyclase/phosphodiesterase [Dehalococcoidia bacterium]
MAVAAITAVSALWIALELFGLAATVAFENIVETTAAGCAAAACFATAVARPGRPRAAWMLIGAGCLSFTAGDVIWTYHEVVGGNPLPSPGWPDVFYLTCPPLFLAGFIILVGARPLASVGVGLNSLVIGLAAGAVVWFLVLGPTYSSSESSFNEKLIFGLYPILDLMLLTAAGAVGSVHRGRAARVVVGIITLGLLGIVVGDLGLAVLSLDDSYGSASLTDVGWIAGFLLIGLAAMTDRVLRADFGTPPRAGAEPVWRNVAQLAVVPLMFAFCAWVTTGPEASWANPALMMASGAGLFALGRQVTVGLDNQRLNRELIHARQLLERRVEQRTQEAMAAESRLRSLTESATDAIVTTDQFGRILSWNRAARRLFGYSAREMAGKPVTMVFGEPLREGLIERWRTLVEESESRDVQATSEAMGARADGSTFPMEYSISAWQTNGEIFFGAIVRDVTERKRNEARLVYYADFDALTGLLNRRRLEQEVAREIAAARRMRTRGALFFMDLDRFKSINDSFGHHSGDELLVSVAAVLREVFADTALLSRLSGDEFAILLPQTPPEEALGAAEMLIERLRQHRIVTHGQTISVTASVGIALYPEHGTTVEELLVHADQAMYWAKDLRDRVALYSSEREGDSLTYRQPWEQRIREGLEHDLFALYLQPIQDRMGGINRWEVLLRLIEPDGEAVPPGAFLDAAERSGLIHSIDRWVVQKSLEFAARYPADIPMSLEINLSGKGIGDQELLRLVEQGVEEHGIDSSRLIFEITETVAIADVEQAKAFITRLKAIGCRFALDDFGVGFSSFYSLKQLDVDYLKIDGSFIRNLANDPVDREVVTAITHMAHAMGVLTVAEFVGDAPTAEILREIGVDYLQGYHVGMPVPAEQAFLEAMAVTALPAARWSDGSGGRRSIFRTARMKEVRSVRPARTPEAA